MTYGIVSDLHFHNWAQFSETQSSGINLRLELIISELLQAAAAVKTYGGTGLYVAGDTFHVRGSITPSVMNPVLQAFEMITKSGINVRIIPGNHDLETKHSLWIGNSAAALKSVGCEICYLPTECPDDKVLMIAWEPDLSRLRKTLKQFQNPEFDVIIHAPLNGVITGIPDKGLSPEELADLNFNRVFCGHYHNFKEFPGGVYSIGALTHQTWGDVGSKAGFLIVENEKVIHFPSRAPKFIDFDPIAYDGDPSDVCRGNYVRVKLEEASEADVETMRDYIMTNGKASGVVINVTPPSTAGSRSSNVAVGASLEASIDSWISENIYELEEEVLNECMEILGSLNS